MSGNLRGNMIMGTVLASVLGVMGLREASNAVFDTHYPEKPGYVVEVQTAPAGGGADAAPRPIDWGVVLADAARLQELVAKGEKLQTACKACHTFEPGGANGTGPALYGVFNRVSGAHAGYAYSDAMKAHAKPWDYNELAAFLAAPATHIRGTKMSFAGYRRQDDQIALVAYLRTLSPSLAPLPAPLPADAPPADAPTP